MKSMFLLFWSQMKPKTKQFYFALFLSAVTTIISIVPAKIIAYAIDTSIIGSKKNLLLPILSLVVITIIIKTFLRYIMIINFEISSQHMLNKIRIYLYDRIQKLDVLFYNNASTGDIMAKMTGDLDVIRHAFSWIIYNAFEAVLLFVITFIYLSTINLKLTLLLLLTAPFIVLLSILMFKKLKPIHRDVRTSYSELNSAAQENISGNRVVKAFVREEFEKFKMKSKSEKMRDINIKVTNSWLKFGIPIDFLSQLLNIVAITGGSYLVIKGEISLGDMTIFMGLSWSLSAPLRMSGTILNDIQRFSASTEKISSLYFASENIKESENPLTDVDLKGDIVFDNVSLTIDGKKILDKVNFQIKEGETVAIMGPTGSGKTILVSLLLRLYDVSSGKITMNGYDIKNISFEVLRKSIGISMQDVFLFSNTIEGNIAYSNPNLEFEEIQKYATLAQADKFIKETPEGYTTIIGERGVGLSGGQKQRISLARAFAVNAPILILDDTTSAVDMDTEKKIQASLLTLKNSTKIIIAQRISSVHHADKILIFDKGKIADFGVHSELKSRDGYYKKIYEIQHSDIF